MPVPKTNPPSSIENDLRLIAILPVLAKVLESIVGRHLLQFLEPNLDTVSSEVIKADQLHMHPSTPTQLDGKFG